MYVNVSECVEVSVNECVYMCKCFANLYVPVSVSVYVSVPVSLFKLIYIYI